VPEFDPRPFFNALNQVMAALMKPMLFISGFGMAIAFCLAIGKPLAGAVRILALHLDDITPDDLKHKNDVEELSPFEWLLINFIVRVRHIDLPVALRADRFFEDLRWFGNPARWFRRVKRKNADRVALPADDEQIVYLNFESDPVEKGNFHRE